ncbi:MAG TPA: PDZ domain-containing protein [Natronosporangium sp.]
MQRRGVTVLIGAVMVMVLTLGVMVAPVPYVVLQPGPTWDTLGEGSNGGPLIDVEGDVEVSEAAGELHLTTVSVQPDVSLVDALYAWFSDDDAVVPRELVYPPEQSEEEIEQRNAEQFTTSQTNAEVAALTYLGYRSVVEIARVVEGAPADGVLQPGDVITAVDGTEVTKASELQQQITARPVGSTLRFEYLRNGQPGTAEITTAAVGDGDDTPRIGVEVTQSIDAPFELHIELDRIGGPSAGLMFALGIIDKLEPEDLTGGMIIAGTGTIDAAGNVGPIGGIPQKLVAARELGAEAFLVPTANCAEARANAQPDLTLVKVDTLTDALDGLADLREGRNPETC